MSNECWDWSASESAGFSKGDTKNWGSVVLLAAMLAPAGDLVAAALTGMVSVSAGYEHTCGLTSAGGVKCWGSNSFGQLGDNTGANLNTPVDVLGLTSGVLKVASGGSHSCAVTLSGGVKCWGNNWYGQLGDNTTTHHWAPVDVSGLSGIVDIALGGSHSCALTSGGAVKCWGANWYGQLGDGTDQTSLVPRSVSGLSSGVAELSAGSYHNCARTNAGAVKCWGYNDDGELGDGTNADSYTPVNVSGLGGIATDIGVGSYHSCAVVSGGGVKCWGYNSDGQLGNSSTADSNLPVNVTGLSSGITEVSGGAYHSCGLTSGGGAKCWGGNWSGQLGNGAWSSTTSPVTVAFGIFPGASQIDSGYYYNCVLVSGTGGIKCWGDNYAGQLGNGSVYDSNVPVNVLTDGVVDGDIILALEEPVNGGAAAGVGNLRGYAVSPDGIDHVDFYVDGVRKASIPYGGKRGDVAAANPDIDDALTSGFAQSYNFGLLPNGSHQFKIRAYSYSGGYQEAVSTVQVRRFHKTYFNSASAVDVSESSCSVSGNRFMIQNLLMEGQSYDVELQWQVPMQQFGIVEVQHN